LIQVIRSDHCIYGLQRIPFQPIVDVNESVSARPILFALDDQGLAGCAGIRVPD
jgi:hypothetical protein